MDEERGEVAVTAQEARGPGQRLLEVQIGGSVGVTEPVVSVASAKSGSVEASTRKVLKSAPWISTPGSPPVAASNCAAGIWTAYVRPAGLLMNPIAAKAPKLLMLMVRFVTMSTPVRVSGKTSRGLRKPGYIRRRPP